MIGWEPLSGWVRHWAAAARGFDGRERRRYPRIRVRLNVTCQATHRLLSAQQLVGLDISLGGVRLAGKWVPEVGTPVRLILQPDGLPSTCEVEGTVVWNRSAERSIFPHRATCGVKFERFGSEEARNRLSKYLIRHLFS